MEIQFTVLSPEAIVTARITLAAIQIHEEHYDWDASKAAQESAIAEFNRRLREKLPIDGRMPSRIDFDRFYTKDWFECARQAAKDANRPELGVVIGAALHNCHDTWSTWADAVDEMEKNPNYRDIPFETFHEICQHSFHSGASVENCVKHWRRGGMDEVADHGQYVSMEPMRRQ